MRKIYFTIITCLIFGFANSQNSKWGIKTGTDLASYVFKTDNIKTTESHTALYLGTYVDITATKKFHIQPELLLLLIEESVQLQLPILAKVYINDKFSILAGPDLLVDCYRNNGSKIVGGGVDFGVSYDLNKKISLDAKYNLGLTDMGNSYYVFNGNYNQNFDEKRHGLYLGFSYKF